jgi:hypothetical protein
LADEEQEPRYDRWSRPQALSRRGYVLAVVVPLLIAACAFGLVSLFASDESDLHGTSVRLPVSGYAPEGGGDAAIRGALRLDDQECVYLQSEQGSGDGRLYVVWPAGFKATRDGGRVSLYDENGKEIAQDGDYLTASGSYAPAGTFAGEPCLPSDGEVAVVESGVQVTD